MPVLFFVVVGTLFPLAFGPDPQVLRGLAPALLWMAVLLAALLSLEHLFRSDYEDGSLEQLILSPQPLVALVAAKITAHWLCSAAVILPGAILLGVLFDLPAIVLGIMLLSLLLGTPLLSLTGAVVAALTVGIKQGGALSALLLLPLNVPVLIFGTRAAGNALTGLSAKPELLFLGGLLWLTALWAPPAVAAILSLRLE